MFNRLTFLFFLLMLSTSACALPKGVTQTGSITAPSIDEASGLAVSRKNPQVLWVHNDSGDSARIFAINTQGEHLATVRVNGVKQFDWEDMASFVYQGQAYLLIADVGDNHAKRAQYQLHLIKEPEISQTNAQKTLTVEPVWSMNFTYADGTHDSEAVAVDVANKQVLLLTKRDTLPILYQLPLLEPDISQSKGESTSSKVSKPSANDTFKRQAKKLGELPALPTGMLDFASIYNWIGFAGKPTSMDISADGLSAVVLTYTHAFYYSQSQVGDWLTLFSSTPKQISLPSIMQAEAISFSQDAQRVFITSERLPAPLYQVDVKGFN